MSLDLEPQPVHLGSVVHQGTTLHTADGPHDTALGTSPPAPSDGAPSGPDTQGGPVPADVTPAASPTQVNTFVAPHSTTRPDK